MKKPKKDDVADPFKEAEGDLPAPEKVTKKLAAKILKDNFLNIEKKTKSGKTLTIQEAALVQQIADGGETDSADVPWADNQVHLGKILDVTRKTIQRWLKIEGNPGAESNGKFNVAKWKEFARAKGHEFSGDEIGKASSAKADQILLQNEKLRDNILKSRGELIPRVLAKQILGKLLLSVKSRTFASVSRFVMLARMAPDTTTGAAEIHKELTAIWQAHEDSKWLKS